MSTWGYKVEHNENYVQSQQRQHFKNSVGCINYLNWVLMKTKKHIYGMLLFPTQKSVLIPF